MRVAGNDSNAVKGLVVTERGSWTYFDGCTKARLLKHPKVKEIMGNAGNYYIYPRGGGNILEIRERENSDKAYQFTFKNPKDARAFNTEYFWGNGMK